jgi:hypothetical protein
LYFRQQLQEGTQYIAENCGHDFSKEIKVEEFFLCLFHVSDTTSKGLAESLLDILNNLDVPLSNCLGQAHDNGSNMKRKNNGTHAHIIRENQRVRYVLCCAHSLNPAVSDYAKSSVMRYISLVCCRDCMHFLLHQ